MGDYARTVFVRNLAWTSNESGASRQAAACATSRPFPSLTPVRTDLQAEFAKAGNVVDARVIRFKESPAKSRGFGFVTFSSAEEAAKAVQLMHGAELAGRQLFVQLSEPREPRFPAAGSRAAGAHAAAVSVARVELVDARPRAGGSAYSERALRAFPQLSARFGDVAAAPLLPGLRRILLFGGAAHAQPFAPARALSSAVHAPSAAPRLARALLGRLKRVL